MSRSSRARFVTLAALALVLAPVACTRSAPQPKTSTTQLTQASIAANAAAEPLPSWRNGPLKQEIRSFVERVSTEGSADFVTPEARIAVFDNDGTLWQERPPPELAFVFERLPVVVAQDPSLKDQQPFKAALARDTAYFQSTGPHAYVPLVVATHGGMTEDEFDAQAKSFFARAHHPRMGAPYASLVYRPMIELLDYLRSRGFVTYISTGGDMDFMRTVSRDLYGIPPERVIGSVVKKTVSDADGNLVIRREKELQSFNDKLEKVVNIDNHIGRVPIMAVGNVGNGGDIAMLEYSKGRKGASMQLLVNHDDPEREFVYGERDNASLDAAKRYGFDVVSMQKDWVRVF